jgi:hypothetical protein
MSNRGKLSIFENNCGVLTLPNGATYEVQSLRPHPIDPTDSRSSFWYEGDVSAKDDELGSRDIVMRDAFYREHIIPSHRPADAHAHPLQLVLAPIPDDKKRLDGKTPDYIGTLLTSQGFYTLFARKMDGKDGLLLAGSVVRGGPEAPLPVAKKGRTAPPVRDPA